jgi:putative lipoic acid-binding regulatory protein
LTACSNEKKIEVDSEKGKYKTLNIKINVTNPESKDDKLDNLDGLIVIKDLDTNETVKYEGYPKSITFD